MIKPYLLLDLDRTLFKTDEYWQDFAKALARSLGVPDGTYSGGYDEFLVGEGRLQMVDYSKILAATGAKHDIIRKNLTEICAKNQYLYDDAQRLLSNLGTLQQVYEVQIITFGENDYQNLKLSLLPELKNIPKHIIQELKTDYISTHFNGGVGMLVDDKYGQDLPAGWAEIHLKRQQKYEKPATLESSVYEITSLDDVLAFKYDTERGFVI